MTRPALLHTTLPPPLNSMLRHLFPLRCRPCMRLLSALVQAMAVLFCTIAPDLSQFLHKAAPAAQESELAPLRAFGLPIIWVLGGPGSGKGTQCERIVAKYGYTHLSTGDLLRDEVASGSSRGAQLNAAMQRGELVPTTVVLDLLKEAMLARQSSSKGFLIDGYPREEAQGVQFEEQIGPCTVVLYFEVSPETMTERLLGRAKTSGRVDDNAETIKKRLDTFKQHSQPVVQHFAAKCQTINGERSPEEIFADVEKVLDSLQP